MFLPGCNLQQNVDSSLGDEEQNVEEVQTEEVNETEENNVEENEEDDESTTEYDMRK